MGDQDGDKRQTRDALGRIVVMLLALAALAERASSLASPVRCLVLWILRPAETAAREFATEITQAFAAPATSVRNGNSSADAMRMASQFRAIAQALDNLTPKILGFAEARRTPPENPVGGEPYPKNARKIREMAALFAPARWTVLCPLERRDSS